MTYQVVPDTVRATFKGYSTITKPFTWSMYFSMPGFTADDMSDLYFSLLSWAENTLAPLLSTAYHISNLILYDLRTQDGEKIEETFTVIDGEVADQTPAPQSTALVLSYQASKRGRWNQGRVFLPFLVEQKTNDFTIDQTWANSIEAAFNSLIAALPEGWVWSVVSRYLNKSKRTEAVWVPVVIALVKNLIFGQQKRRLRRNKT